MLTFRFAKKEELATIAELYTDAFIDYPFSKLLLTNEKKRKKLLYDINLVNINACFKQHYCIVGEVGGEIVSSALLLDPDIPRLAFKDYLKAGGIRILLKNGPLLVYHILHILEKSKKSLHISTPYWYLETLAVDVKYQGRGYGSQLLREFIIPFISKRGGGALALTTHTRRNCIFYKKNGFTELDKHTLSHYSYQIGNWSFLTKIKPNFMYE